MYIKARERVCKARERRRKGGEKGARRGRKGEAKWRRNGGEMEDAEVSTNMVDGPLAHHTTLY